jgi:hypothetical protein
VFKIQPPVGPVTEQTNLITADLKQSHLPSRPSKHRTSEVRPTDNAIAPVSIYWPLGDCSCILFGSSQYVATFHFTRNIDPNSFSILCLYITTFIYLQQSQSSLKILTRTLQCIHIEMKKTQMSFQVSNCKTYQPRRSDRLEQANRGGYQELVEFCSCPH